MLQWLYLGTVEKMYRDAFKSDLVIGLSRGGLPGDVML